MPVERHTWNHIYRDAPIPHRKHDSRGKYSPQKRNSEFNWNIHKTLEETKQLRIGERDTAKLTPLELDIIDGCEKDSK